MLSWNIVCNYFGHKFCTIDQLQTWPVRHVQYVLSGCTVQCAVVFVIKQ